VHAETEHTTLVPSDCGDLPLGSRKQKPPALPVAALLCPPRVCFSMEVRVARPTGGQGGFLPFYPALLRLAARRRPLLLLAGHLLPALCDQIQDALIVLEPLLFGQLRVTLANGHVQAPRSPARSARRSNAKRGLPWRGRAACPRFNATLDGGSAGNLRTPPKG
jgi:hypothetical protein